MVPNVPVNVSFTIDGPAVVVGVHNGDAADHSPDKSSWRCVFLLSRPSAQSLFFTKLSRIDIVYVIRLTGILTLDTLCDQPNIRNTFHGLVRAIVASSQPSAAGIITVTAAGAGLVDGKVVLVAA